MKSSVIISRNWFLFLCIFWCLSLVTAVTFTHQVYAKDSEADDYSTLRLFTDVLGLVQKNYYKEVNISELVEGAVKGMVMTLDPHSGYLPPDTYKELQVETKGEFGGLGIEISVRDGLLTVISPVEDSPAARAGVLAGDQIIKIDDEFAKNLSLVDAVKKMRGPRGTPITLTVHRDGYPDLIPFTIIRDIIKVKSVRGRMLSEHFAYIRIAQFQEDTFNEYSDRIQELKKKNGDKELRGLVLDLRNNPGGLLTQAIKISDIFLKDGIIVYTDGRLESQKHKYLARDDRNEPDYPLVVLVNGGSASAAEIVSGALQDAGRALILGTQTFGKGSVQTIIPMNDNRSALRLTTALYFTKSGRSIQAQGVTPDMLVQPKPRVINLEDLKDAESLMPREADLPGAIKNPGDNGHNNEDINNKQKSSKLGQGKTPAADELIIGSRAAMEADLAKLLKEDPQLDEAIKVLTTWATSNVKPNLKSDKDKAPVVGDAKADSKPTE